jgi:hypothetical protein
VEKNSDETSSQLNKNHFEMEDIVPSSANLLMSQLICKALELVTAVR